MIKIFGLPSHQEKERTHGVDFARVIQPLTHLGKVDGFETTLFDIKKKTDWLSVNKTHKVIFLNYINNPWGFAAMGAMARKMGNLLVMDIDDDIWNLHEDNPAHKVYYKGSEALANFTAICNEVDYITTTSNYLRNVIISNTNKKGDQVKVFRNYIDLDLYSHRSEFKDTNEIMMTHFGSTTHFEDLLSPEFVKGVDRIMKKYPHVKFRSIGAFLPKFRNMWGLRYENPFGHQDIYQWIKDKDKFPQFMDEADFMLVPLVDDVYNRCKSEIKWLEASSAKIPGVWQDIRQYQDVVTEENGFLAKNDSQWFNAIDKLIQDKELRRRMGEQTFHDVQEHTIQGHIGEYAEWFKYILDKK